MGRITSNRRHCGFLLALSCQDPPKAPDLAAGFKRCQREGLPTTVLEICRAWQKQDAVDTISSVSRGWHVFGTGQKYLWAIVLLCPWPFWKSPQVKQNKKGLWYFFRLCAHKKDAERPIASIENSSSTPSKSQVCILASPWNLASGCQGIIHFPRANSHENTNEMSFIRFTSSCYVIYYNFKPHR
jgi:hypothetical protein